MAVLLDRVSQIGLHEIGWPLKGDTADLGHEGTVDKRNNNLLASASLHLDVKRKKTTLPTW